MQNKEPTIIGVHGRIDGEWSFRTFDIEFLLIGVALSEMVHAIWRESRVIYVGLYQFVFGLSEYNPPTPSSEISLSSPLPQDSLNGSVDVLFTWFYKIPDNVPSVSDLEI